MIFLTPKQQLELRWNSKMPRPSHDAECIGRIILNAKSYSNGHHLPQELCNIVWIYWILMWRHMTSLQKDSSLEDSLPQKMMITFTRGICAPGVDMFKRC